ncbi:Glycosyltransferase involved in cell wall bisynthesis [Oceanicaulis sp. 350]|nr:Glycosyltransferase involved in cell wall bisynthesis [Oceanicaulis sp. 350]
MRVALIHYWLVGMRGGEKVLEALCRMFPDADIFTHVYDPDAVSDTIRRHKVIETSIAKLPFARKRYQAYLPFMPGALERLDLSGYDLVISSEAGPAKGVIVPPNTVHICYCHSPMRYLWDQQHIYREGAGFAPRLAMDLFGAGLRQWDVTSAARVDHFIANSNHVAKRIEKYWRREASVVHPPVAVEDFSPVPDSELGDFYLMAGELRSYKRPDLAVEAFNRLGKPLVVIGGADSWGKKLEQRAKSNIKFLGKVPFEVLKDHMARCKALVFPGEEDFGIIPVEAQASGRPVIAFGRGGARDTVVDGETGLLFDEQSIESLIAAIERFETLKSDRLDPQRIRHHARSFSEENFRKGLLQEIEAAGLCLPSNCSDARVGKIV